MRVFGINDGIILLTISFSADVRSSLGKRNTYMTQMRPQVMIRPTIDAGCNINTHSPPNMIAPEK